MKENTFKTIKVQTSKIIPQNMVYIVSEKTAETIKTNEETLLKVIDLGAQIEDFI